MKRVSLKLTSLVVLLGGVISVNAQTHPINVVTTSVPFLRTSTDVRSAGMADASIATAADANSSFGNIAKMPFNTSNAGVAVSYTPWLRDLGVNDVYLAALNGYYKLDDLQAVSAGIRYFGLGSIEFTDGSGNTLNTYRPKEMVFDLGYSRKLSAKNSIGIALKYVVSDLAGTVNGISYKKGNAVAGDLHFYHNGAKENGEGFSWGATLSNLGTKISYTSNASQKDYIPANLGIGGAYTKVFDADSKMTFALDLNKLMVPTPGDTSAGSLNKYYSQGVVSSWFKSFGDAPNGISEEIQEINASLGIEYWYQNQFAFRAGYFYENPTKGNRKFLSVGAGLKYSAVGLNFAYIFPSGNGTNRNPLSNTYRFGLVFDLDGKK